MSAELHPDPQAVRDVFAAALDAPAAERAAFVAQACGTDDAMRAEVESLLAALDRRSDFLSSPTMEAPPPQIDGVAGQMIGRYKILQAIGEGGFGTVYMAEQSEPVRRRVALKVIKPGMDTRQVVARFDAERQALAMMDHPNIARVFDGGATDAGRPYFVMELVRGTPINDYCDRHNLPPRGRLELFVDVCHAVQHAHQKGIIHRDLKPSNVLVTAGDDGRPTPKVIDFGIAKATAARLTERTLFTEFRQLIGTPEYMSPEQAEPDGVDVDTRSDVYSLGVLLYELLTGTTPFDARELRSKAFAEIQRIIREVEPPRPSTRISTLPADTLVTVAGHRKTEPARLGRVVRGELDWIVMRAMEKDRNRRYETASSLAADVERYLGEDAVLACPPSAGYRFRKFVRRNRRGLAVASVLCVALLAVLGTVAGSVGWVVRDRTARHAVLDREVAAALDESDAAYARDNIVSATAAVRRAQGLLDSGGAAADAPLRQSAARRAADLAMVAELYAIPLEKAAVKDGRFDFGAADPAYRQAFARYGLNVEGDAADAARRIRESAIRRQLLAGLDDWAVSLMPDAAFARRLRTLATAADDDSWRNRFRAAWLERDGAAMLALAADPVAAAQPPETIVSAAMMLRQAGELPRAVDLLRGAYARTPDNFWINHNLAQYLMMKRPPAPREAIGLYRAAIALRPASPGVRVNLANALSADRMFTHAAAELREAIRLQPDYATPHLNLGMLMLDQQDFPAAEQALREYVRLQPGVAKGHFALARALARLLREPESAAEYAAGFAIRPEDAYALRGLADTLVATGREPEAEPFYQRSLRAEADWATQYHYGNLLLRAGRHAEAEIQFRAALAQNPAYAEAHTNLAWALQGQGRLADAESAFRTAVNANPGLAQARDGLEQILRGPATTRPVAIAIAARPTLAPPSTTSPTTRPVVGVAPATQPSPAELRERLRKNPHDAFAVQTLAYVLSTNGEYPESRDLFARAISLRPKEAGLRWNQANVQARLGEWKDASASMSALVEIDPRNPWAWARVAALKYQCGDADGYRRARREISERFVPTERPEAGEMMARYCLLLPDVPEAEMKRIAGWMQKSIADPTRSANVNYLMGLALLEYRDGRFDESLRIIDRWRPQAARKLTTAVDSVAPIDATMFATRAMGHHRLGNTSAARTALAAAREVIHRRLPNAPKAADFWFDQLIPTLLCREAGELIGKPDD